MTATIEPQDRALDIKGAAEFIRTSMGLRHVTDRMVVRMADQKKLPFFKLGKCRVIFERKLIEHMQRRQTEAEREVARHARPRGRRG